MEGNDGWEEGGKGEGVEGAWGGQLSNARSKVVKVVEQAGRGTP
jgi:hypothetical protein